MHKLYKIAGIYLLSGGLLLTVCGCSSRTDNMLRLNTELQTEVETELAETDTELTEEPSEICVFVCGQVKNPGVYRLEAGSRVCDAIEKAGGCLDTADMWAVNQAEILTDESRIYIPEPGEDISAEEGNPSVQDGRISLNHAGKEELMTLPGIGEAKADSILEYRELNGGFKTIEELMNIPGIKEGIFQKIQDCVMVE